LVVKKPGITINYFFCPWNMGSRESISTGEAMN